MRQEPRPDEYTAEHTVFIVPIYQLLSTICRLLFFRWPTELMGTANARTEHCSFHNENGHYTTRCGPFKRYLKELAAVGHLNQWIDTVTLRFLHHRQTEKGSWGSFRGLSLRQRQLSTGLKSTEIDQAIVARVVCTVGVTTKQKWEDPNDNWSLTFTKDDFEGVQIFIWMHWSSPLRLRACEKKN